MVTIVDNLRNASELILLSALGVRPKFQLPSLRTLSPQSNGDCPSGLRCAMSNLFFWGGGGQDSEDFSTWASICSLAFLTEKFKKPFSLSLSFLPSFTH